MEEKYFQHWCSLVIAISILFGNNITEEELDQATLLIDYFLQNFNEFYGLFHFPFPHFFFAKKKNTIGNRWMSINIHHLKHLVHYVKKYGPLWSISCFPFESLNFLIGNLIHGTGHVLSQVRFHFLPPTFFFRIFEKFFEKPKLIPGCLLLQRKGMLPKMKQEMSDGAVAFCTNMERTIFQGPYFFPRSFFDQLK